MMKLKKIFVFFLTNLFFFLQMAKVGNCQDNIANLRNLYDQGKYSEVLEVLEKKGLQSSEDYYNAGNCYYRLSKFGQAVAHYEKALSMHPVHKIKKDIEYNKNLAIDQLQKSGALLNDSSFLNGKLAPAMNKISSSLFYLLTSICSFLMIVILLQNLKSQKSFKQIFFKSSFLSLFSFWLLLLLGTSIKFFFAEKTNAMIIADTCIARSGPKESFTELFKLPAGTKVELLDSEIQKQDSWRKIRFSLGNEGWVMEKDLLKL